MGALFIFFIISIFLIIWILINILTKQLSISITKLKDFAIVAARNKTIDADIEFPNNELGEIGAQIVKIYNKLRKAKDDVALEKAISCYVQVGEDLGLFWLVKQTERLDDPDHWSRLARNSLTRCPNRSPNR